MHLNSFQYDSTKRLQYPLKSKLGIITNLEIDEYRNK